MGIFKRAKSRRRPQDNVHNDVWLIDSEIPQLMNSESIGEALSVNDQFELTIPVKRPVGILKKDNDELIKGRKCLELNRSAGVTETTNADDAEIDHVSTASSLTATIFEDATPPQPAVKNGVLKQTTKATTETAAAITATTVGTETKEEHTGSQFCATTIGTNESNQNSLVADNNVVEMKKTDSPWLCIICRTREATDMVNDEDTTLISKRLKSPKPLRRGTSLFDDLEEEESAEVQTTFAIVELEPAEEEEKEPPQSTKWLRRFRKVRSIPKIGLRKVRSLKRGNKKSKGNCETYQDEFPLQ